MVMAVILMVVLVVARRSVDDCGFDGIGDGGCYGGCGGGVGGGVGDVGGVGGGGGMVQ